MSNLLDKASIVTTPTAYENGKILSVKPTDGIGDFDFTRNSSATRVNSQGLTEDVASGLPRIDYTDGVGSWLFEPQSTNEISYSEDFSNAYWSKLGSPTITSNYGTSPNGQNNSVRIQGNSSTAIYNSGGFSSTDGRSIYVKATSGSGNIQLLSHNTNTDNVFFINENWKRVEINTAASVGSLFYAVDMRGASTDIFDIEIWGAQIEQLSYATSYIPTNGSTVTRLQDAAFGAGSSDLINSTEGVLYGEIAVLEGQTNINRYITINNGTDDNIVSIHFRNNALNQIRAIVKVGNSNQCDINYNAAGSTSFAKFALKWKVNDFAFWVNGVKIGDDLSGITFNANTLNKLSFDSGQGGDDFFGKTKCLAVFKEALTDAELTCLTTI